MTFLLNENPENKQHQFSEENYLLSAIIGCKMFAFYVCPIQL
jgi:hypothetical protein